jgi:uncharacterized OB-fold protein
LEKITNNRDLRTWSDHIPLEWWYTAGVAGERFLQLLKQGKIQAAVCRSCNKTYVPPKIFCKDCFVQLTEWKEVPEDSGYIYSYTRVANPGNGVIVLVKFGGIEGGLLSKFKAGREEPRIGMKVKPVFKRRDQRRGEIYDIEYFEKI